MTHAYFDCYSGISGDMILGALVDAGVPFEELKSALAQLPVDGYEITANHVQRCGIGATQIQVRLTEPDNHKHSHGEPHAHSHSHEHTHDHDHTHSHEHSHEHAHGHSHEHDHGHTHTHTHDHGHDHTHEDAHVHPHAHDHVHTHEHGHAHTHSHSHHHGPHRGFSEIRRIIEASSFSQTVKERAIAAFHKIAVEEAAVHETTVEAVHFHEVGAVDAIVDIVGAMWCIERLGITCVTASTVAVGSGMVHAAHGHMPVPAPATARLLAGKPITTGPVTGELTTPTGAAILTTLADEFGPMKNFTIERVAYGAGTRQYPSHTNYLRVLLGKETGSQVTRPGEGLPVITEQLHVITAEIDDMPSELLAASLPALLEAGALDAHFVPVQMKKNRPAVSLHVLTDAAHLNALVTLIFKSTSTLGLKVTPCTRLSLHRRTETVNTRHGSIRVKTGLWDDQPLKASPEYEDCLALAGKAGVPVMQVYQEAAALGAQLLITPAGENR